MDDHSIRSILLDLEFEVVGSAKLRQWAPALDQHGAGEIAPRGAHITYVSIYPFINEAMKHNFHRFGPPADFWHRPRAIQYHPEGVQIRMIVRIFILIQSWLHNGRLDEMADRRSASRCRDLDFMVHSPVFMICNPAGTGLQTKEAGLQIIKA